ncbi:MAG: helix-turn-helix transcriptional regulator [Flavobacterium sp.]
MKKSCCFILFLFTIQLAYSKNNLPTKEGLDKQFEQINNPSTNEDIAKIEDLIEDSKEIDYPEGIIKGKMNLLNAYNKRSDYKKMRSLINDLEAFEITDNEQISSLYLYKFFVNKALGIQKEGFQNLKDALNYAKLIENPDKKHLRTADVYNMFSMYYDFKSPDSLLYYLKQQLKELEQISDGNKKLKSKKYTSIALNSINIGNFYLGVLKPARLDLAEPYYLKIYEYKTSHPDIFEENDMPILCGTGRFYLEKGIYKKTVELANEVLKREKDKKNPTYRMFAYQLLADSNEELKNSPLQAKYTLLYAKLSDSLNSIAKKEVGKEFDRIVTKKENEHNSNLKIVLLVTGIFIFLIVLAVWLYWKRKNKGIHQKYEDLIAKINVENKDPEPQPEENESSANAKSSINITDETLKKLLVKIEKFERSDKYLKKEINLTYLANNLGTNTKYLSEIIKQEKGKSFNNYINGLRIDYIVRELYSNPKLREYKISHLADISGFASREVFAIVFKKETGITPSYFINNLKKEP